MSSSSSKTTSSSTHTATWKRMVRTPRGNTWMDSLTASLAARSMGRYSMWPSGASAGLTRWMVVQVIVHAQGRSCQWASSSRKRQNAKLTERLAASLLLWLMSMARSVYWRKRMVRAGLTFATKVQRPPSRARAASSRNARQTVIHVIQVPRKMTAVGVAARASTAARTGSRGPRQGR